MIPVSETLLEYRGSRFSWFSGGDDHVYVRTDGPRVHDDFRDAVEFSDNARDPWVNAGTAPDAAVAAGLSGNQNDGWSALVSPDEVAEISVEITRHPMTGS
ncbi:hypothetical protein [Microbacterium sp. NPDC077184]|uniref:hypothetical protein n=1 Tax=Microbacterium sp. NPDC077184 TaxID=3154764 RepID=UPI0034267544